MACINGNGSETFVFQLKQKQLQEVCFWNITRHQFQHIVFTSQFFQLLNTSVQVLTWTTQNTSEPPEVVSAAAASLCVTTHVGLQRNDSASLATIWRSLPPPLKRLCTDQWRNTHFGSSGTSVGAANKLRAGGSGVRVLLGARGRFWGPRSLVSFPEGTSAGAWN